MKKDIHYILFDVAGTLLHKPTLYSTLTSVLEDFGYKINVIDLKLRHKILSESIAFPDRTDESFYTKFNTELLFSLGIIPTPEILNTIFRTCSYLPWEKYADTIVLETLEIPVGIISNFNSSLKDTVQGFFGNNFKDIVVSEEIGLAKPNVAFYKKAQEIIGVPFDKILYIGDSLKLDIQPALAVGMHPLLIDREGFFPQSEWAINDLKQVQNYI